MSAGVPTSAVKTVSRNLQLDILRGVAILLVIGRHLELPRPDGVIGSFATVWYTIGWLGVDLFFVLSGFLIGGLLLSEYQKHGQIDVARFLVRRGLKIYPPYFIFITYLVAMPTAKVIVGGGDAWAMLTGQAEQYWPNLLFLQNYVGTNPAGHTWTLAVEEHFYLMLPFVLLALIAMGRMRLVVPLCLVVVPCTLLLLRIVSVWTDDSFAAKMSATHLRLDALLFGVGIRAASNQFHQWFAQLRNWRGTLFIAGVLLWLPNVFVDPGTPFIRTVGLTWTFLGAGAFLVASYHTHAADFAVGRRAVVLVATLVGNIGIYSYAIYLWHVTALGILGREVGGRIMPPGADPTQVAWLVSALILSVGAVVAGVIATRVVEWPVLRIRDRFFPSRSASVALSRATPTSSSSEQALDAGRPAVADR